MDCNLDSDSDSSSSDSVRSTVTDSTSDESQSEPVDIKSKFAQACSTMKLTHVQINSLLEVFREHKCFKNWPKDARTLLQTPRKVAENIYHLAGGEYVHFGMEDALSEILLKITPSLIPDTLIIDFSTDGGNLDKQAKRNVWPIQIRVHNIPGCPPGIVGIWCGTSFTHQPTDASAFFAKFIKNFNDLMISGFVFKGICKVVRPGSFIADAPARAFALGHMAHNSDSPCSRCKVCRTPLQGDNRALRTVDDEKRNDREYRDREDAFHHKASRACGLADLEHFDIVNNVVFDSMHAVFLGIVKRFLSILVGGRDNPNLKLDELNIVKINVRLAFIKNCCPEEFARRPEDITKFSKMKATEFRQILLYSGAVAFRGIINSAIYLHFLTFSCAIRLLTCPKVSEAEITFAENLIKTYVKNVENFFNHHFLTYNCHILLHLAEDVRNFGPLDGISAFPYENNMQYFAATCRKPTQYLEQIVNRREERKLRNIEENPRVNFSLIPGKLWTSPFPLPTELISAAAQYQTLQTPKYKINTNNKDNIFMLKNKTLGMVQNIILDKGKFKLLFQKFNIQLNSFFQIGNWQSSFFGVFRCSDLSDKQQIIDVEDIHAKCFCMPYFHDNEVTPTEGEFIVTLIESTIA
ncbi:uncharacterized protein LOC122859549 isoform X1 [Aphidius gifuensis]|uniref:uncharacterized protein LOC122859549 isoform X1 n=1 Tax=Aphidius gifuensis TaxID=684658 RepID=UPI001CDB9F78|nr:uncharacterized protein LOC122859549 isoform X1 [Aphidius gifuensis]